MDELRSNAVVDRLQRAVRFWKTVAISALTALCLVVLVLILGLVVSTWQAIRATRAEVVARRHAEAALRMAEQERARAEKAMQIAEDERRRAEEHQIEAEKAAEETMETSEEEVE